MESDSIIPMRRSRRPGAEPADRLPPHSPQAERGVIGCLLVEAMGEDGKSGEAMEECLRRGVDGGFFYDLRHQTLFELARVMHSEQLPFDLLLVTERLRASGQLEAVGGITYINEISGEVPSASNIGWYLDVLKDKHALRSLIQTCVETASRAYEEPEDVVGLVSRFESVTSKLSEAHVPTAYAPITTHLPAFIDMLEARHRGKQAITGIETPWWYLNNQTAGLQPNELIIIGARPSTGKTAMGLDIIRHAMRLAVPTLFFSIEMSPPQILTRLIAAEARVDGLKLRNGFWSAGKEDAIREATERVASWHSLLYLDHRSRVTGQDVWVEARRAYRQHKIGLVVVDYLQMMQATRPGANRNEEVGECSAWLKRVAKELPMPVVAMAQLNRESEKDRGGRPPTMADLRESGNVEQDADCIALLWRPRIEDDDYEDIRWMANHQPDDPKADGAWFTAGSKVVAPAGGGRGLKPVEVNLGWKDEFQRVNLNVEKNRNGPTGPCELLFQKRSTRFVDLYSPNRVKEQKGEAM